MRRYTLDEIDQMRADIKCLMAGGRTTITQFDFDVDSFRAEAEDRLRTHMQNGTSPGELRMAAIHAVKARA